MGRPGSASRIAALLVTPLLTSLLAGGTCGVALAQCPEAPALQSFTGTQRFTCPCFVSGEEAGAVFQAPPSDYPLELLRVGIAWGSQFGGTPASLESAIHVYAGGLPNPGPPIFTLDGPVLNDGAINQFDLEPLPGRIAIDSGPFTVTLEFLNSNSQNPFAPSVVHDGNGCQPGKNVVFASPGGWSDACALGVSGDWVFFAIYRPCVSATDAPLKALVVSAPVVLLRPRPDPFAERTEIGFVVGTPGRVEIAVVDVAGRTLARLADAEYPSGTHRLVWTGRSADGMRVPQGVYFAELRSGGYRTRQIVRIAR